MTVGKRKAAGAIVITRWVIDNESGSGIWIASHFHNPKGVIDAVFPFVQQDEGQAGARIHHLIELSIDAPLGTRPASILASVTSIRQKTVATDPIQHRNAAHAGHSLTLIRACRGLDR